MEIIVLLLEYYLVLSGFGEGCRSVKYNYYLYFLLFFDKSYKIETGIYVRKKGGIKVEIWEASYVAGIIDGEGSITLTRMHSNEHRRPCISIASTDKDLLIYIQDLIGGVINNKKNYKPEKHKDSFVLSLKKKNEVFSALKHISPFLRVPQKKERAKWILEQYENVTPRGKV